MAQLFDGERQEAVRAMRVAVSGTHCCGKSTLIDQFLLAHPEFAHEPEPYTVLQEDYGEVFAAEPSPHDFYQQLEFNVERLRCYRFGERVICERSPIDFLAYMLALNDLGRSADTTQLVERSVGMVREAIEFLDVIVFLPLNDIDGEEISESEDPELRIAVDRRLADLLIDEEFNFFTSRSPVVLEARGSTEERLRKLEGFMETQMASGE